MNRLLIIVICMMLASCSGKMQGVTSDGKPVTMKYTEGLMQDTYTVIVDGEVFKGKAVRVRSGSAANTAYVTVPPPVRPSTTTATNTGIVSHTYTPENVGAAFAQGFSQGSSIFGTGRVRAALIGSRGNTLQCEMQYASSGGMTIFGGVGTCRHSDGRTVTVQW